MEEEKRMYKEFKKWAGSNYKRTDVSFFEQTLEDVDFYLHGNRKIDKSFLDLDDNEILKHLEELKGDKVFRHRHPEAIPRFDKLRKALSSFVNSEARARAREELRIAPLQSEKAESVKASVESFGTFSTKLNGSECISDEQNSSLTQSKDNTEAEEPPFDGTVRSVLERCEIRLDGAIISREAVFQDYLRFLYEVSERNDHNIGITLHTGSIVFDALAVVWATVSCLLANKTSPEDIVRTLQRGDLVEYEKNGRCIFEGTIKEDGRDVAKLLQNNMIITVHKDSWNKLKPYYGNTTNPGRRGTKSPNEKRRQFFKEGKRSTICV